MTKSKKLKKQGILKPTKTERWKELRKSLYKDNGYTIREAWFKFNEFVDFDERPLHPSQFIPWDKEKNCPLEKSNENDDYYRDANGIAENYYEDMKQYQKAESEVLFEGFTLREDNDNYINISDGKNRIIYSKIKNRWNGGCLKRISDLSDKIYLTPEGKKLSGL